MGHKRSAFSLTHAIIIFFVRLTETTQFEQELVKVYFREFFVARCLLPVILPPKPTHVFDRDSPLFSGPSHFPRIGRAHQRWLTQIPARSALILYNSAGRLHTIKYKRNFIIASRAHRSQYNTVRLLSRKFIFKIMTMTGDSPPLSPSLRKYTDDPNGSFINSRPIPTTQPNHPTLPAWAIRRSIYYQFPTPPHSPHSPTTRVTSPLSPSSISSRRPKHGRTSSQTTSAHSRRRSSLSKGFHISQLSDAEYGPPPYPAPTTPLPPIPGAPRVPYTTPAQVRNRFSSYELYSKLMLCDNEQKQKEATKKKRHSAPALKTQLSLPLPTLVRPTDIRRTISDTTACHNNPQINGRRRSSAGRRPSFASSLENRRSKEKLEEEL